MNDCVDHRCDNCAICGDGECCRELVEGPGVVELFTGPVFGALGVVERTRDGVRCALCGEWFVILGLHLRRAHAMNVRDYRAVMGLRTRESLVAASVSDARADRARLLMMGGILSAPKLPTKEQDSKIHAGRKHPIGALHREANRRTGSVRRALNKCKQGHDLVGDNVQPMPNGKRVCRTCHRARQTAYYQRKVKRQREFA